VCIYVGYLRLTMWLCAVSSLSTRKENVSFDSVGDDGVNWIDS
jgi:hypothetical protein